jgi:5-methylcytosine-specific restriction protein A
MNENERKHWIFPANINMYDIQKALTELNEIDWKTVSLINIGDIVYIYCTAPIQKIMSKTIVTKTNINKHEIINDSDFFLTESLKINYQYKKGKYDRLKLLRHLTDTEINNLSFTKLKNNGITTVSIRNGLCLERNPQLLEYIKSIDNDYR